MAKQISLSMLLFALCACAIFTPAEDASRLPTDAEVDQYNALVEAEERIICRVETQIGSNIPTRVCRLVRDIEETSDFHREQLRNVLR